MDVLTIQIYTIEDYFVGRKPEMLQHRDASDQSACCLAVGVGEPTRMQRCPHLVFQKSAGSQGLLPKRVRRLAIFGE